MGILGCGPRALQMAAVIKLLPECCCIAAMSDPDEQALLRAGNLFPDLKLFPSSDHLLDSGVVDAVITEIPPAIHTEYVIKALARGIHVLGEIPAVNSIEEGDSLWNAVRNTPALYMCAANANYRAKTPFMLKLRDLGLLGHIAYIETEYLHDMRGVQDDWRRTYESCRYCTHSLGPILALLAGDELCSVACMSTGDHFNSGFAHNAMSALFRTTHNVVIRFLTAFGTPQHGPHHKTKIFCEKGIIELYNEKARVWLTDLNEFSAKNDFIEIPFTPNSTDRPLNMKIIDETLFRKAYCGHNGADLLMVRDFAEAILTQKPSPIGIRAGLSMTLPGIYAALSAREDGELKEIKYPWNT